MKRMMAMTMSPGAVTAAARLMAPSDCAHDDRSAGADEHEEEGAEEFAEEPAPLVTRVVEVVRTCRTRAR